MVVDLRSLELGVAQALALLGSADTSEQYYAAWLLGNLKDPLAVEALIGALQDTQNRTALGGYPLRRKAAEALGRIGDLRAILPLIDALDTEDLYLRDAAAWSLGELGDPRAIEPLVALLDPEAEQPHEALLEALGKLAVKHPLLAVVARELVLAYFQPQQKERTRCAAARCLYEMTREDPYAQFLVARLQNPDITIRRAVTFDLAEIAYLPAAGAIARADLTTNLKVHALKQMVDLSTDQAALEPVLATLATLF
ncbi:HEAT repeat domain-containing protein [Anthocerotibacter panamensis]|uniref:HEAT repeat domain-containing protein n=1 Tax=Anthocerotibacter panamensis TaxID=2857077 RepID=UPI001C4045A9|nr:HEAT repeat domain-containing protein [Anthocerotibacter panamensis]